MISMFAINQGRAKILAFSLGATALTACGGVSDADGEASEAQSPGLEITIDASVAEEFLGDLPDASEVPEAEIGDLYFKLLTRLSTKIRAIGDAEDAQSTLKIISYARAQADTLKQRADAMPADARAAMLESSAGSLDYAKSQYERRISRIDEDSPDYLQDFAKEAGKPWPEL